MNFLTVSIILLFYGCEVFGEKQCNDCVLLRNCPAALDYLTNKINETDTRHKIRASFCGKEFVNGSDAPKICCSNFNHLTNRFAYLSGESYTDSSMNDEVEMHKNLNLLPESCGSIDGNRIVGGEIAGIHEFPWMALISHRTLFAGSNLKFICGGSIISSRYILTAAHCVVNKIVAGVRIGEFDIRSKDDCQGEYPYTVCESHIQDRKVEKVIAHEGYQSISVENDIALLRLEKPIDLTYKNAKPICLPVSKHLRERNITSGNKIVTVAGWGLTEAGTESVILRKVKIPVYTSAACREFTNINNEHDIHDLTSKKLCAGELNKDSCSGDSGGPLMFEDEVNNIYRIIQYGIVSYGPKQCGSSSPGIYTDVTKYIKWILDNIKP